PQNQNPLPISYYPECQDNNSGYGGADSPNKTIRHFWGWTPFYNLVQLVFQVAAGETVTVESVALNPSVPSPSNLNIEELDLQNELDLLDFTVEGRLIFDNMHNADGTT